MTTDAAISAIPTILLLVFSSLAKEHIPMAALALALLSMVHRTRTQQRRIEKLEDEYEGQRSINRAAAERHRTAYLALQQSVLRTGSGSTARLGLHYDHPSAETVRENRLLKDRMYKLRTTTITLQTDVERKNTAIERLQRDVETLRILNSNLDEEMAGWKATAEKATARATRYEKVWRELASVGKRRGGDLSRLSTASCAKESSIEPGQHSLLWQPLQHQAAHPGLWKISEDVV